MFTSPRWSGIHDLSNKIFSIHVPLDDRTTIKVILREIDEEINCVSVFQNHMTLQMVRIWLYNRPAKPGAKLLVKSANKNTAKYDSTCKGSEQTWIKHFSFVRLCCDCRAACGSRTQRQLQSWVAHVTADAESRLPSFARNHWLE